MLAGAALLAYHGAVHGRGTPNRRIAANLTVATASVAGAAAFGVTPDEMGIAPARLRRGARVGVVTALPLVAGVTGAFAARRGRTLLHDRRVDALAPRAVAFELIVRIPLETALAEEILFRGVHYALVRRDVPTVQAVATTSLVFGLWHVPPALAALGRTTAGERVGATAARRTGAVAGTVAITALAGAGFTLLRIRSGSLLAPVIVHAAVNATAFSASWIAARPR